MKTKVFEIKGFKKEKNKEDLWNAFHQMVCIIPNDQIEMNQEQIRIIAEYIEYPEEELFDLCEYGYVTPSQHEEMVSDMLREEEKLTYGY